MAVSIVKVLHPQTVEAIFPGPGPANWLFVFTGIAEIDWKARDNDILTRDSLTWRSQNGTEMANSMRLPPS